MSADLTPSQERPVRLAMTLASFKREWDASIYAEVRAERERAHAKHGTKSMESWAAGDYARLAILTEEIGEVAREFNEAELGERDLDLGALRKELIQVAAMAAAWADSIGGAS